jgi:CDP-glucose 4,6-dehydratase
MENPRVHGLKQMSGPLLLTGHTGFKGAWLTLLLEYLEIPVVGYSLPAEKNTLYERAELNGLIAEEFADIRDYRTLENFVDQQRPSTIIHMAAQPLVLKSYEEPNRTFDVNVMGTANILDIAFKRDFVRAVVVVTTDKVYKNDESGRVFVESDPLEGKDPYSGSKVGAESVVAAWQQIAKISGGPTVVSVRAGNVIGGGDASQNRLIPDIIQATREKKEVEIRNPKSVRPWQHVLDPLYGYLLTISTSLKRSSFPAFNFGPDKYVSVDEVVNLASKHVFCRETKFLFSNSHSNDLREAQTLRLNSALAKHELGWLPRFDTDSSIWATFDWWHSVLNKGVHPLERTRLEIEAYFRG